MANTKIAYTERDYLGLRNELLRLTNQYYPDLIKNANDSSIYSVFLDLNAALGDNLNFQIDRTLQETVLQYAQQRSSLYNIARTYGLKIPGNRPSITVVDISITVPAFGDKEDFRYLGVLRRGAQFKGGGQVFELLDDCDFASPYSNGTIVNRTKIPNFDSNGILINYTITKREVAVNGLTKVFKKEITNRDSKPFYKLFLPEKNVIGVSSILLKQGTGFQALPSNLEFLEHTSNRYYEVEALASSEIFIEDDSLPADIPGLKVGKYVETQQRFVTEYTPEGFYFLTFGSGNDTPQSVLDDFASKGISLDFNRFLNNVSLGSLLQPNSTIFVQYRVGGGKASNLGAGAINNFGTYEFIVSGPNPQINNLVLNSINVTNVTSAIGGADQMSMEEIRNFISFNFAAQNRAVTINDYASKLRTMPSTFGAPAKVGVCEIENKILLKILSYTPDGKLTTNVSSTLKQNIATYLSNYRMLNDYIEVGSAKVIDIAVEVEVILAKAANRGEIVTNIISSISDYLNILRWEMGYPIPLGQLKSTVVVQPGVINLLSLRIFNRVGGEYSQSVPTQPYGNPSLKEIALLDDTLFAQPDEIYQVRFPQKDISVRVKQPDTITTT